jgi:TolB-like protein/Flp pilus assembly protein TadD
MAAPTAVASSASPAVPPSRRPAVPVPVAATALVLGILIGLGVLFAWRRSHTDAAGITGERRLAVLPFENLGDSTTEYFADGMTDEVRGKLSQVPALAVIARASSNEYRRSTKSPQQIARELGAEYLLTATVRWEKTPGGPSRVRVSPELVQVQPGAAPTTKWQQGFDASLTDVFQVQADIATKVASALNVALGDSARHDLAARPTANLAAYDAFLKGEAASQGIAVADPASLRRAIDFYEQAVALDSAFLPAWGQLARARAFLYTNAMPTPELGAQARHAAERARSLGPDRPEGQIALGDYYRSVEVDNRKAVEAVEVGLKLAPNNVDLLVTAALTEQRLGQWNTALQHLAKASALDPRSASTARRTGVALLYLRRYPEAHAAMDRGLALAPTNLAIIEQKAMVSLAEGDLAGARAAVRRALTTVDPAALLAFLGNFQDLYWVLDNDQQQHLLTLPPSAFDDDRATWAIVRAQTYDLRGNPAQARIYADSARLVLDEQIRDTPEDGQRHSFRGLALAYLGRKAEAIAEGRRGVALLPIGRDAYIGAYLQHQLARIYTMAGEPEQALDQLEALLKIPYYLSPGWLRIDPTFDSLRKLPRFQKLTEGTS